MFTPIKPAIHILAAAFLLFTQAAYAQVADFTADKQEGCVPHIVKFIDASTGTALNTKWFWEFGNGNTSTKQSPDAIFPASGVYDVTLTVSNGDGPKNTITRAGYIVVHDLPEADFTASPTTGCAPLSVKFSDKTPTSPGQIASWFWVFGDGATSTVANPIHIFEDPGDRSVSLKVRNEHGCVKTKTISSPIKVLGPITKFSPDKSAVCTLPATFQFTNETTGGVSYQWDFGDGETSTLTSPSHKYTTAGTYEVVLKARDANGCEHSFKKTVNAGSEGGLDIDASSLKICENGSIDFKLVSTDAPVSTSWDFGDGHTSTLNDDTHQYEHAGIYTVTLTSKLLNHTCNSVVSKTVLVATPSVPTFTHQFDCSYNLTLTSTSTNTSRVEWYIEDAMVSSQKVFVSPIHSPGVQNIRLVAFDAADCSSSLVKPVELPANPSPAFEPFEQQACEGLSLSGCAPFDLQFVNKTGSSEPLTMLWEFGDGGSTTQANPPLHRYTSKGVYQVTLTATNARGCAGTSTGFVVVADKTPLANFTVDMTTACAGEFVTFTSTSTDADYWCWDFGDQQKDTGEVVQHKFNKPGTYTVRLLAKNAGCSDEEVKVNVITIKDPYVTFEMSKACIDPYTINLENNSENYDEIYWDFGDGKISDRVDTVHSYTYEDEGIYQLELVGTNHATNCEVHAKATVVIQEVNADFEVNTDKPCKGAPLVFTDKSHAAVRWEWTVAGKKFSDQNPTTKLETPGDFIALLKVTDSDGCEDTYPQAIKVLDIEGNFTFVATSDCDVMTVNFENQSAGTEPMDFEWDFGDGTLPHERFDKDPSHPYDDPRKYTVSLTVTNPDGECVFSKTDAVNFTVPVPAFESGKNKNEFCPGDVVVLANTTKNAVLYEWDYGDGRRSDFVSPSIPYSAIGSYDISLFATDAFGCEKKILKEDFILIDKPTADFSVAAASGECPPFIGLFTDESKTDIEDWQWDFGDGQSSTLQNPTNTYLKPGKFNVTLSVIDDNGCTDTKIANHFVTVGGPTGSFIFDGADQCTNELVRFTATTENAATLQWDFGDGNVVETSNNEVSHNYTSIGSYTPNLLLIDSRGCENIAEGSTMLFVKDTTAVSVSTSPICIKTGEPFMLVGKTENEEDEVSWSWLINGIPVGDGNNLEASLDQPGMYTVTGLATNKFNCLSNAFDTVRIQGPIEMIPNVITPNGDGANESFRIIGLENSIWNIDIVNRWGNTVYKRRGYNGDWDGEQQPAGVYYYVLRNAVCEDRDYKGYISIVR